MLAKRKSRENGLVVLVYGNLTQCVLSVECTMYGFFYDVCIMMPMVVVETLASNISDPVVNSSWFVSYPRMLLLAVPVKESIITGFA